MLKVTISGHCGEGKTTLALIIEKALEAHGITARVSDPDVLYATHYPNLQDQRVQALVKKTKTESVLVETVQTRKGYDVEQPR